MKSCATGLSARFFSVKSPMACRVDGKSIGKVHATPRPALLGMSAHLSGSHVLEDSFATISFAAFVPEGHDGNLAYVGEFLEEAKASGLIKSFIERAGLRGMKVARPKKSN
jgi:hypothetical protein